MPNRAGAEACGFDGYEVKLDRPHFLRSVAELLGLEGGADQLRADVATWGSYRKRVLAREVDL